MNGPPQNPTSARSGASSARTSPTASSTGANASSASGTTQRVDRVHRAHGLGDDGTDAFDELDVDSHAEDGSHDVGEEHSGIDLVPPHRLQRHLGAELGRVRDLPEGVPLA